MCKFDLPYLQTKVAAVPSLFTKHNTDQTLCYSLYSLDPYLRLIATITFVQICSGDTLSVEKCLDTRYHFPPEKNDQWWMNRRRQKWDKMNLRFDQT